MGETKLWGCKKNKTPGKTQEITCSIEKKIAKQ